jgi:hypothetical protein
MTVNTSSTLGLCVSHNENSYRSSHRRELLVQRYLTSTSGITEIREQQKNLKANKEVHLIQLLLEYLLSYLQ